MLETLAEITLTYQEQSEHHFKANLLPSLPKTLTKYTSESSTGANLPDLDRVTVLAIVSDGLLGLSLFSAVPQCQIPARRFRLLDNLLLPRLERHCQRSLASAFATRHKRKSSILGTKEGRFWLVIRGILGGITIITAFAAISVGLSTLLQSGGTQYPRLWNSYR